MTRRETLAKALFEAAANLRPFASEKEAWLLAADTALEWFAQTDQAHLRNLASAADEYLREFDNPAQDYHMRRSRRDQMRIALAAFKEAP